MKKIINRNDNSKNYETQITEEERLKMVSEKAYLLAESRGFLGDSPLDDWFNAEKEVNQILIKNNKR